MSYQEKFTLFCIKIKKKKNHLIFFSVFRINIEIYNNVSLSVYI